MIPESLSGIQEKNYDYVSCNSNDLTEAAEEFFNEHFGYSASIHTEQMETEHGIMIAFHAKEDSATDHFYGLLLDNIEDLDEIED